MRRSVALLGLALLAVAAEARASAAHPERTVAILLFPGVQVIDVTGPSDVFATAYRHGRPAFRVVTVAHGKQAVTGTGGLVFQPEFDLATAPPADVVVVPGGMIDAVTDEAETIAWLRREAERAEVVVSVCNGAFALAKAGLLDGKPATTTAPLLEDLQRVAPRSRVTGGERVIDTGRIVTSGGLSAGIDAALHVVERLHGRTTADTVAGVLEYNWKANAGFRPGRSAARYLMPVVLGLFPYAPDVIRSEGTDHRWTVDLRFEAGAAGEAVAAVAGVAAARPDWTKDGAGWTFHDVDGRRWRVRSHRTGEGLTLTAQRRGSGTGTGTE